jgi:hypothetical protein
MSVRLAFLAGALTASVLLLGCPDRHTQQPKVHAGSELRIPVDADAPAKLENVHYPRQRQLVRVVFRQH